MIVCILKESGFAFNDLMSVMHYLMAYTLITDANEISNILLEGWKKLEHKNAFFGIKRELPTCSLQIKKSALYANGMNVEFLSKPALLYGKLSDLLNGQNNVSISTGQTKKAVEIIFSHSNVKSILERIANAFLDARAIDKNSKPDFLKALKDAVIEDLSRGVNMACFIRF